MSTRRVASATSVAPHALKNSPPPPNVAAPKQNAGTFNPDCPSRRYSIDERINEIGVAMAPTKVGACLWLLCFQFFVAEQIARLGWTGHYSMRRNYISDLGAH